MSKAAGCFVSGLGMTVVFVIIVIVCGFLFGVPVTYLINYLVPGALSYLQAVSIVWLVWLGIGPVIIISVASAVVVVGAMS